MDTVPDEEVVLTDTEEEEQVLVEKRSVNMEVCAEIFLTHQSQLVFHCCLCNNPFDNYAALLDHLIETHYGLTKMEEPIPRINFRLKTGDKLEGRCAEVLLTDKCLLVYHCSMCNEMFHDFWIFLKHLIKKHHSTKACRLNLRQVHSMQKVRQNIQAGIVNYQQNLGVSLEEDAQDMLNETISESESDTEEDEEFIKIPKQEVEVDLGTDSESDVKAAIDNGAVRDGYWKCTLCEKRFTIFNTFKEHIKSHRTTRKFKCPQCGQAFKDKMNCKAHIRRHFQPKRFKCKQCSKMFHHNCELVRHRRVHTGERPYMCPTCGNSYRESNRLTQHMKRHSKERKHRCDICNRVFFGAHDLTKHKYVHSDVRRFSCEQCGAQFKLKNTLHQHMKLHLNELEYVCEFCGAGYNQRPALYMHLRYKHEIVDPKSHKAYQSSSNRKSDEIDVVKVDLN